MYQLKVLEDVPQFYHDSLSSFEKEKKKKDKKLNKTHSPHEFQLSLPKPVSPWSVSGAFSNIRSLALFPLEATFTSRINHMNSTHKAITKSISALGNEMHT